MYNKKADANGNKRLSVSSSNSFSSLNTYKSMSTYQSYLTVTTDKLGSTGLNRNDSRRLLDSLEFTAEEEMLIKTFRRNASKRSLSSKPSIPAYIPPTSIGSTAGHYKEKKEFKFGNTGTHDANITRKLTIDTTAAKVAAPYVAQNKNSNESSDKKHKKNKSWAFNSKDKNSNDSVNLSPEDGFISPSFVKQHKKKNSSFSLRNLFKKPNNQAELIPNTTNGPQQDKKSKLSTKYDSFETLEHFQNNGNDEEFLSEENFSKERDGKFVNEAVQRSAPSTKALAGRKNSTTDKNMDSEKPRKNLISLEGFAEQRKGYVSKNVATPIMADIADIESAIEEYLANAILLKQNNKFNESTDCLLLAILAYKKKYTLLKASNRKENLNDRTPFLLYGIALKMGIGSSTDINSSTENLKIAAGLSSPVESDDDDTYKSLFENTINVNSLDGNNLIIPERFRIKTKEQTYGVVGPSLYELALNYLYSFLPISIYQDSAEILEQTNSYTLSEIRDGLKYLSLSILIYNHLDSYNLLLEVFAYGIKISDKYLIKPNRNSYREWLIICEELDIPVDAKLQNVQFNLSTAPNKAKKTGMKRSDTLERLNQLKLGNNDPSMIDDENEYLTHADGHDDTIIEMISIGTSFTDSKKNEFENGAHNMFVNYESEDDDLDDIMDTYT